MGTDRCARCGGGLASRDPTSLQRVWAWWLAGVICYIPANTEPMLLTKTLFQNEASTIVGGAVDLWVYGDPFIAFIILLASVGIPVAKFICIAWLALSVQGRAVSSPGTRHLVYHVVEYIGRWSMIDVFVVAILAALVNLGIVMGFNPGAAAFFFALSVACTMVSALSLDPRLLWDMAEGTDSE